MEKIITISPYSRFVFCNIQKRVSLDIENNLRTDYSTIIENDLDNIFASENLVTNSMSLS